MFSHRSPGVTTVSNGLMQALILCLLVAKKLPLSLKRIEILFELPLKLSFLVVA
jgi:hypothetical protein